MLWIDITVRKGPENVPELEEGVSGKTNSGKPKGSVSVGSEKKFGLFGCLGRAAALVVGGRGFGASRLSKKILFFGEKRIYLIRDHFENQLIPVIVSQ